MALGFEEGGEGERFLRGQSKIGHARGAEVLADARWVLQKLEQPCWLVTKSCAAEVRRKLTKGGVRCELSVALGAADLDGEFATAGDLIGFGGKK